MNKKLCFILLIICAAIIVSFSGCGDNEVSFYFGISENPESNTKLELNTQNTIDQKKEKILNSELVFNKNNEDVFDNMYLCFKGSNINSVVVSSENKTVFYDHYNEVSRPMDVLSFYYTLDESQIDEYFNPEVDMMSKWDNGQLDDIKNVYFNGMSISDITRTRRDLNKEIGNFNTNLYTEDNLKYINNEFYYLDHKNKVNDAIVYTEITLSTSKDKKFPKNEEDIIVQGKSVETNHKTDLDSFIYRYEKLFYNSQQAALKSRKSFDYSDLVGETIEITVNFTDESTKKYSLDISFDNSGNIIANLGSVK